MTDPIDKDTKCSEVLALSQDLDRLTVVAGSTNTVVDGISVCTDVMDVHTRLKHHMLVFSAGVSPPGNWSWGGLHEIKNKSNETTNPNLRMLVC